MTFMCLWACVCVCMTWCIRAWANIDVYWCIHYSDADTDVDTNAIGTFALALSPFSRMSSVAVSRYQMLLMVEANGEGERRDGHNFSFKYQQNSEYEKELEDKTGRMVAVWWINPHTHTQRETRILCAAACIEIFINSELCRRMRIIKLEIEMHTRCS